MRRLTKTAGLLAICLILLLVSGCEFLQNSELPAGLNSAKRPLILVAKGREGVLIKDADGKLYSYSETYYFAQVIMASELVPGDIISGN